MVNNDFEAGDVAFGKEKNEIFRMAFTRNNVRVIIHTPTKIARTIALEIDKAIQNAPVWTESALKPAFVLHE